MAGQRHGAHRRWQSHARTFLKTTLLRLNFAIMVISTS
jgi:hypothetical protein